MGFRAFGLWFFIFIYSSFIFIVDEFGLVFRVVVVWQVWEVGFFIFVVVVG